MRRWGIVVAVILWLAGGALPLTAAEPHRAGLVIVHGDGRVVTRCVTFAEESISGVELLVRSGLELRLDATGVGTTICSIAGEGCPAPSSCFCQCQSSPCVYWSYWQLEEGAWRYSNLGAGLTQVRDGTVEGWVWGEGSASGEATAPPVLGMDEICGEPVDVGTGATTGDASLVQDPQPAATLVPVTTGGAGGAPMTMFLVTGAPLLLLLSLWWWARQRRKP